MAIKALGESLLSSAKKKAKRGQKLGQLAGLAMIGMSIANSNIRKKAMTRYNEWNNSLTPIKKALDENLLESGRVEAEYKERSGHAGGELQSFIDAKFEMLKKAGGTVPSGQPQPSDQEYLAIAKKEALPEFKEYRERVEAYQDIFGIKDEEYYKQYNRLNKLTTAELKNDNLMELLGNRTGWGKDTSQIATEIMLANNRSATLNIPANILAQFDTEYFDELSAMAQQTAKIQKVRKERLLSLSEQSKNRDSKVLLELVTPKRSSAVKIDEQINKAWETISKVSTKVAGKNVINTDYIGNLKFIDEQFEDEYTVAELLDELDKINSKTQKPIKDTEINAISNKDVLINTAKELAQFEKEKFMVTGSGVVDDIMYKGWMKEGFQKALAGVVVEELNVPYWFDKKIIKLKYEEDTPPPPPDETPVPIVLLRNKIAEYQDNPMGMPSGVLKDIQRIVEELPEYKDEFSVYLPEEEDMTNLSDTDKSYTFKTDINISDRPIINKIIEVESSGNPNAVSDHGAKGLMQLKDSTADNPGLGVRPAVRNDDGFISPEENVRVGTDYFDALTEKYGGDLVTAAMAYNAGMGTIDKWIAEGRDFSKLRIETQDYVKKIFGEEAYNELKNAGVRVVSTSTPAPTPAPTTSKSLLSMDEDEVMRSAAADKAREEAAEIPGQVVEGVINIANRNRINNLEKDLERVKDNKRPIMMLNSSMRDYLEENYNVTSLRTLSKPDKIKAIEELIELLKS